MPGTVLRNSKKKGGTIMGKWNEEGSANNNLSAGTIESSKLVGKPGLQEEHEFSEELADGGERDKAIEKQLKEHEPGM
jgi:hypothetical protein